MEGITGIKPLILSVLLSVGISGTLFMLNRPAGKPVPLERPAPVPSATAAPTATISPIVVFVSGAVRSPGVYTLPAESRVVEAIEAAGGPTEAAAVESLNQATLLDDGMQVHMPEKGSAPAPAALSRAEPAPGDRSEQNEPLVRINSADQQALESLPGIGPALASRILAYRNNNGPFTSVEQIAKVRGIGDKLLEQIRERVLID